MYNFARWCVGVILCIIMLSLQFDGKVQIGRVGGKYAWRLASSRPVQGSKRAPWCATFFEMRAGYNSFSKLSCQVGSAIPVWCIIMNNARSSSATSKIIEGVLHVASCQLPRIAEVIIPSTPTPSQDSYVQRRLLCWMIQPTSLICRPNICGVVFAQKTPSITKRFVYSTLIRHRGTVASINQPSISPIVPFECSKLSNSINKVNQTTYTLRRQKTFNFEKYSHKSCLRSMTIPAEPTTPFHCGTWYVWIYLYENETFFVRNCRVMRLLCV